MQSLGFDHVVSVRIDLTPLASMTRALAGHAGEGRGHEGQS
jgi:hypothetical protein